MKEWFGAAAILFVACPVFAGDVAVCTLGADKKKVTVTASVVPANARTTMEFIATTICHTRA